MLKAYTPTDPAVADLDTLYTPLESSVVPFTVEVNGNDAPSATVIKEPSGFSISKETVSARVKASQKIVACLPSGTTNRAEVSVDVVGVINSSESVLVFWGDIVAMSYS
jgi:hypothetical protein